MSVIGGQLIRCQIDSVDFEPVGGWTIKPSFIKREHSDSSRASGKHFFKESLEKGSLSGEIAVTKDTNTKIITDASDILVLVETPVGKVFRGVMTYVGDAEYNIEEGKLKVELEGKLEEM